jgi:chromosome condensin MukBEF ATPase and DNA-binding subunit MukB
MSGTTKGKKNQTKVIKANEESKIDITETNNEERTDSMGQVVSGSAEEVMDQQDVMDQKQQKLDITTETGVLTDANTLQEDKLDEDIEEPITPLDIPIYDLRMMTDRNEKRLTSNTYTKVFSTTI